MNALIKRRGAIKASLTRFKTFLDKLVCTTDDAECVSSEQNLQLQKRLNDANSLLADFAAIHNQIIELKQDNDDVDIDENEREQFENDYYDLMARAESLISKINRDSVTEMSSPSSHSAHSGQSNVSPQFIKLPTINLPKFQGDLENWLEYREIFNNLIHENKTINDIQKLHYLKASLVGDASQIIKSLEFTSTNYHVAWDSLCARYNNPRMLVHNHLKAIFDLESLTKESAQKLRKISDTLFKHITSLKMLASEATLFETFIIQVVSNKLDPRTSREWETVKNKIGSTLPTLDEFKDFLKNNANILETLESKQAKIAPEKSKGYSKSFVANTPACLLCKKSHFLSQCEDFLKLSSRDRFTKAKELKVCLNCLTKGHFSSQCTSTYNCRKCKARHHTALHLESRGDVSVNNVGPASKEEAETKPIQTISAFSSNEVQVLLPTATAQICDSAGNLHTVRVLLDSGSQSNFILSGLCKRLNLQITPANITVTGLSKVTSHIRSRCDIELRAHHSQYKIKLSCLLLDEITGSTPSFHVNRNKYKIPDNIRLSDPSFNEPGSIDLLIGSPVFWELLCIGQIRMGPNLPILQKTRFGWIVSGPNNANSINNVQCNFSCLNEVPDQLARFWELENYPTEKVLSDEENACEAHFSKNTCRDSNGRFVVKIPFKKPIELLGDSFNNARKRFLSLEKRLQSNPILLERYSRFMKEYEDLGHMSIANTSTSEISYFLPHHGVLKEESLTTKLRVVFNGSAATSTGHSVNSIQMVGPTIQQDLFSILLRFRKYQYVISADIEKMYRQVQVEPSQRRLQSILWRSDPSDHIQAYVLNTVTYGTASASFLAIRCLMQLGNECEVSLPAISRVIKEDFYVDDLLTGADTVDQARDICQNLSKVLKSGCFNLRKWVSNDPEILDNVPKSDIHPGVLEFGAHEHTNTLGLIWSFQNDQLMYSIPNYFVSEKVTKRTMLSEISQIFDPLGLLSPCTLGVKIILQQLWLEKLSWDDPVPIGIQTKWSSFRDELFVLNNLKIIRHAVCKNYTEIELHGFCDASMHGYGASIYLRSKDTNNQIYTNLLCSKAKVAPLKPITIPKLELCGATLLAKLLDQVLKALNLSLLRSFLWSDSTIVLGWLKTSPNLLKTFVCNRVAEIQRLTPHATWRHVPTKSNPADILSRGASPQALQHSSMWWHGPAWLSENESSWPSSYDHRPDLPEFKVQAQCHFSNQQEYFQCTNFSTLTRLERVVSYCLRFRNNCLSPNANRCFGALTPKELQRSLMILIKISQLEYFSDELKQLKRSHFVKSCSTLARLNPFLDSEGLIRVGGRLHHSQLAFNKKHPILLSGKHYLAKLIILREHLRLLHAGPQLLLSNLRERFWITSGRNLVKQIIHKCVRCFRFAPKVTEPIMGNLPATRVQPSLPFHVTGIDYAGPLMIKDRKGRGCKVIKSYLCLFVCFSTKAVHLELVTDLSTEVFLLAFRRFVARRGKPLEVFSDNGTNFVGANSELKELGTFLKNQGCAINELVANDGINWHFVPAHSPHFGGLWEAGVKSCKHHLKRMLGTAILNFEELCTLLAQIEATLNSRPIFPMSSDPNDLQPLTPAHFLVGRPLTSLPDPDVTKISESRLSSFQRIQQLQQLFWKRWHKEYIVELQQRSKWIWQRSELKIGELVLLKEDNLPPLRWKLGRIIDLHPGSDGISRVATIKTSNGIVRRSFAKLCPLPIDKVK